MILAKFLRKGFFKEHIWWLILHHSASALKQLQTTKKICSAINLLPKRCGTIVKKPLANFNIDITVIITQLTHFKIKET